MSTETYETLATAFVIVAIVVIAGVLAVVIAGVLAYCSIPHDSMDGAETESASIYTQEHDGHWFCVYANGHRGGICHHPDCPKCKALERGE